MESLYPHRCSETVGASGPTLGKSRTFLPMVSILYTSTRHLDEKKHKKKHMGIEIAKRNPTSEWALFESGVPSNGMLIDTLMSN